MADQGDRKRGDERGDEHEQDGLGRDAAHGGGRDDTTGGSYGRSTGRAGDDLSAPSDAERRRQGLEGRGFDAGTGYGGGGNASAYRRGSGFGAQGGPGGAQIPRGTDEQSSEQTNEPTDGQSDDAPEVDRDGRRAGGIGGVDAVDPDATPEVRRRDPLR